EGKVDGHAQPAFDHFHRAVMMSRSAVRLYHFELGHAAGHATRDADAREIARVIKSLWPESPELWFAIGRTLKSADPPAAMLAFERAANPPPHSASMRDSIVLALNGGGTSQRDRALALARTNVSDRPTRA